jgi:hypothetical protein
VTAREIHDVLARYRLPPMLERILPLTVPGDDFVHPEMSARPDEHDDDRDGDEVPIAWASKD